MASSRSEVTRSRERERQHYSEEEDDEEEEYRSRRDRRWRSRRQEEPWTPLAVELEEVPWPHRFNATTIPQFDGESDLEEFLLKYKVAVESNGGGSEVKAKALVMAMKGAAQHWYTNLPRGCIHSWSQLRAKLLTNFRRLKPDELTSCDFHACKQGEKETLQEYMHRFVKLRAKVPQVPDVIVIDAVIAGQQMGPCGEYLDRRKPRTVEELFDVMQEYSKSDRGRRRRIEARNQEKKNKSNQWSQ
ncbi:Zeon1 gag protein [Panicum miliaceum]|uniref:Zeon1 gag protein n=1 Tax=Panicum miliaceum TaxID=4540 RepID=A0A3L6RZL5_PANMI|nr:Zeon1 gag protein [Panicum miliaceum]